MNIMELKRGDKVKYVGRDKSAGWRTGIYIQRIEGGEGGRVEVKPDGCRLVTVDPMENEIKKI